MSVKGQRIVAIGAAWPPPSTCVRPPVILATHAAKQPTKHLETNHAVLAPITTISLREVLHVVRMLSLRPGYQCNSVSGHPVHVAAYRAIFQICCAPQLTRQRYRI
jgi:hypothetical protein